jgi:hypothetical protein
VAEDGKTEILRQKQRGAMNCYLMVVGLIITFLGVSGFAQTKTTTSHATTLAQVHAICKASNLIWAAPRKTGARQEKHSRGDAARLDRAARRGMEER